VIERLVDDLDGSEATVTVRIGWNGEWRELDLNEKNEAALAKAIDKYWDRGRSWSPSGERTGSRRRSRAAAAPKSTPGRDYDIADLREWAGRKGIRVPQRGRIPRDVVAQYKSDSGA
jgi:hypothetical protein